MVYKIQYARQQFKNNFWTTVGFGNLIVEAATEEIAWEKISQLVSKQGLIKNQPYGTRKLITERKMVQYV